MTIDKKHIEQKLTTILNQYPQIIATYLFGSYANDQMTPLSDIDIAVLTGQPENDKKKMLDFDFLVEADLIHHLPEYKFDVRNLNQAPVLIQGKIVTEGKLLFTKDQHKLSDFEEYVILRYLDFRIDYNYLLQNQYQESLNGR
mgnify:CR=1 FL=1